MKQVPAVNRKISFPPVDYLFCPSDDRYKNRNNFLGGMLLIPKLRPSRLDGTGP
jgi:hypothetical protein